MGKRICALLLALVLCTAALPLQVLAAEPETPAEARAPAEAEMPEAEEAPSDVDENGIYALDPLQPGNAELLAALVEGAYFRGQWLQELESVFGLTADKNAYPDIYYPDIENSAYFDAVMTAVVHGLSDVEPGDPFEPEAPLTRDYAAYTLNYLLGFQPAEDGYTFSDSVETQYPDDAQAVVDAGWLALVDGAFLPGQAVTEAEAQAMLDGAREELAERESGPIENSYVLADYVIQVPASAGTEIRGGTVRITGFDGIVAGDVFAVDYQGLPFVYRADYVSQDGDALVIDTSEGPEDAIVSASFSGEISPELTFTPDEQVMTLTDSGGDPIVFGAARAVGIGKDYIKVSRSITLASGVTGSLNVDLTKVKIITQNYGGQKGFTLTGVLEVSSTVKFDLMNDPAAANLTLGTLGLWPLGSISLSTQLKMEAKMSYAYSCVLNIGVYRQGLSFFNDVWCESGQTTLSAEGTASAKVALTGDLSIPAVASATVQASVGPVIKASARKYSSGTPQTCVTMACYLEAGASVYAKFFGFKVYDQYFPLFTEKNSPIRCYEHIEDGQTVYACTRGNGSGGAAVPLKYVTPGNSRIYVSGNASGSSSWTGSGGEPVVIWTTKDNEDGTVTVTGYNGGASVLNIPEIIDGKTVTAIGSEAFRNNKNIRVVNMADTITSIGNSAFGNCTNLRTVTFSENLTEINSYAFDRCTALTRADLPEGLVRLGGGAFRDCTALEYAYIPSTLEMNGVPSYGPFHNCSKLNSIVFGNAVTSIPTCLFDHCTGLTHIEIPGTITSIGVASFSGCKNLKAITFSENLTEIDGNAFYGCNSLTRIDLPEGLVRLGSGAFQDCTALEYAYIPSTLEMNGVPSYGPFHNCSNLNSIFWGNAVTSIPTYLFNNCTGLTHIEIPGTITSIGLASFSGCKNLTAITVPDSVKSYGSSAFSGCSKLTAAALSPNALDIPNNMFSGCTSLKTVTLPDGVKEIKSSTFQNCAALENLNFLPASVTSIGDSAFQGCTGLVSAHLPSGVTKLGSNCFQNCAALTDVKLNSGLKTIGSYAFQNCAALETIVLPDTVTSIGSYIFQKDSALTSVTLSKGLSEIPSYAFANCTSLERLDIPQGVKTIRDHAFYQDTKLKTFTIPQSVASIGSNAFSYPTTTTVYGVSGSYAETFAKWKEFVPTEIVSASGVTLDKTALFLAMGGSGTITATVSPDSAANKTVIWSTSNASVAEVSFNGVVTAKRTGKATITAKTADGGYTASCTVTITDAPASSGNTMGPNAELTWERKGQTVTVTGPVTASEPLWAAGYDLNGKLLFLGKITFSGGSVSLPGGAKTCRLFWLDQRGAPKCASAALSLSK